MGLYISSHPLDRYDVYFEEQTHPYDLITAENDGKVVIIGGIVSAVRTIMTKSNTRMAFVKLENKTSEQEVIVFPSLYEEIGAKLVQDNVLKVSGRVNAKDKDGNITSEVKVIADSVEIIPDSVLDSYEATGTKLPIPKAAPEQRGRRRSSTRATGASGYSVSYHGGSSQSSSPEPSEPRRVVTPPDDPRKKRLYLLVEDTSDVDCLTNIRRLCEKNPGVQDVIMVLKENSEKRPVRLPFKVEIDDDLTKPMIELLGEERVKVQ